MPAKESDLDLAKDRKPPHAHLLLWSLTNRKEEKGALPRGTGVVKAKYSVDDYQTYASNLKYTPLG